MGKIKQPSMNERVRAIFRDSGDWLSCAEVQEISDLQLPTHQLSGLVRDAWARGFLERRVGPGSRYEYRWNPGEPPVPKPAAVAAATEPAPAAAPAPPQDGGTTAPRPDPASAIAAMRAESKPPAAKPAAEPLPSVSTIAGPTRGMLVLLAHCTADAALEGASHAAIEELLYAQLSLVRARVHLRT